MNRKKLDALVESRYGDLVSAAKTMKNNSLALKFATALIAAVAIVSGVAVLSGGSKDAVALVAGGVVLGGFLYVLAIILGALGDAAKALADIAVNTDPTISLEDLSEPTEASKSGPLKEEAKPAPPP